LRGGERLRPQLRPLLPDILAKAVFLWPAA
jgi:hypothetical protein